MTNISHSTNITITSVTFKLSFPTGIFGIVLSNPPNAVNYGNTTDHTKAGFTLRTARTSGATALNWNYYSLAFGY